MANDLISRDALTSQVWASHDHNPHPLSRDRAMHRNEHMHFLKLIHDAPAADPWEPPCRMGETVWGIARFHKDRPFVKQGIVNQMYFGEDMRLCICVKGVCRGQWGVNVFATREKAEAAIGERRTDNA